MKSAMWCLVFGVLPALGQIAPVAVFTTFQQPPSQAVVSSMQDEASAILMRLETPVAWRSLSAVDTREAFVEVAVATFRGTCDMAGFGPPFHGGKLGWTHVSDGEVLPFAEVDCAAVRGFLLGAMKTLPGTDRERIFGRALGRVLAHELYHILARSTHHNARGVDRPAYTAQELVSDRFLMDESPYRILRAKADVKAAPQADRPGSPRKGRRLFQQKGCNLCHGDRAQGTRNAPALRIAGHYFNPVGFAAKLGIEAGNMVKKAERLKITAPTVDVDEIADLVRFLNANL